MTDTTPFQQLCDFIADGIKRKCLTYDTGQGWVKFDEQKCAQLIYEATAPLLKEARYEV